MTEQPDLASLTIKDLRQLAGEHQIANRSRLGKDELIEALKEAMASGAAPKPAPESAQEPEVIDPASVAFLAPAAQAESDADDEEEEDDEGPDPDETQEIDLSGDPNAPQQGGFPQGEGGGRRRRRRRRRGRGRGGQQFDANGQPLPNYQQQAQGAPGQFQPQREGGDQRRFEQPAAREQHHQPHGGQRPQQQPQQSPRPQPQQQPQQQHPHQQQRHDQRPPQQPPQQQQNQQNGQRPPRPRLDGPQRPMSSVLDRLCAFSRGVLELCNPDTPSWAQPRLSELLAEAGLAPIPTSGVPHAEFHQVVGTVNSTVVPPGHIAIVDAPGFALRGDRGDLFPLRKAKVRIAAFREGDSPSQQPPAPSGSVAPAPADPAPEADVEDDGDDEVDDGPDSENSEPIENDDGNDRLADTASFVTSTLEAVTKVVPPEIRAPQQGSARPPTRPFSRVPPASVAHPLPLATQDADVLASRAKAEGFRSLQLNEQILADLATIKYSEPTPIQSEGIPVALTGKDMIGQAQTGTGKTAAFVLPILQRLYALQGIGPAALVLCPTRELARQVHTEFVRMAGESGARAAIIYGGVSMDDQIDALARNPHVVIGTPGRIIDHMRRKALDLSRLAMVVLDEADQMLDIGFWPDVMFIINHTPPSRQMLLFSATMPDPIKVMAEKQMKSPVHIRIQPKQVTVEEVDQKFIAVDRDRKNDLLAHFIDTQKPEQLVVFCRTKHQTDRVAEVLKRKNYSAGAIHGDLPQSKRERMLQHFRDGQLQSLIATNVAARGLDIPTVSHVVNYDIPENPEEYVHRIGRTARNGARGVARTFITPEDGQFLLEIEKHIGLLLEEEKIEGFTASSGAEIKRTIADMPVGAPRLIKPLVGGIRLGRRRR